MHDIKLCRKQTSGFLHYNNYKYIKKIYRMMMMLRERAYYIDPTQINYTLDDLMFVEMSVCYVWNKIINLICKF